MTTLIKIVASTMGLARNHWRILLLVSSLWVAVCVKADDLQRELRDAQGELSKANNDYYNAIRSGQAKTPEEHRSLLQKTVDPAAAKVSGVIRKKEAEFVKQLSKKPVSGSVDESSEDSELAPKPTIDKSEKPLNKAVQRPVRTPVPEVVPEVVLDGSQIQETIEFQKKGVPKAAPIKKTGGVLESDTVRTLRGGAEGIVDEVEFKGPVSRPSGQPPFPTIKRK